MLLQQLLQRNKRHVSQIYLSELKNKEVQNQKLIRPPNDATVKQRIRHQTIQVDSKKLLNQNFVQNQGKRITSRSKEIKYQTFTDANQSKNNQDRKKAKRQLIASIGRQKSYQKSKSNAEKLKKEHQTNLFKTGTSFYMRLDKNNFHINQRKVTTAFDTRPPLTDDTKINQGVFEIPDFFAKKQHLLSYNHSPSMLINQNQSPIQTRFSSIHSRQKMRRHTLNQGKRKALSQQSFYPQSERNQHFESSPNFIQENFQSLTMENKPKLYIKTSRLTLVQKQKRKKEYVNIMYEFQKAKAKFAKQQIYTPWKKQNKDIKNIDLCELVQLHYD